MLPGRQKKLRSGKPGGVERGHTIPCSAQVTATNGLRGGKLSAGAAADTLLIPLQCEYYALEGLSQLLNTVHLIQRGVNPTLEISGVLLTMYDARLNLSRQVAADAREYFGNQVFETVVPRNVRLAEAPSFGKPIVLYDVQSVGAQAYMAVAQELMTREGKHTLKTRTTARIDEKPSTHEASL